MKNCLFIVLPLLTVATVMLGSGCIAPPERYGPTSIVHMAGRVPLDQVISAAHSIGEELIASQERRPISYPRDASFLVGTWEGVVEIHNFCRTYGRNISNTDKSHVRYEFRNDGTYSFSASRTIQYQTPGFRGSTPMTHSGHGTWSYSDGQLKYTHYQDGESTGTSAIESLLWHGDDVFEFRMPPEQEMSLQTEFLKDKLLTQAASISDKGVSVLVQQLKAGRSSIWNCGITLPRVLLRVSTPSYSSSQPANPSQASQLSALSALDYDLIEHKKIQGDEYKFAYIINNESLSSQKADAILRKGVVEYAENDFRANHPGIDALTIASAVTLDASSRSSEGKKILVYTVSPYSTQPVFKKLFYDENSRKGSLSLEINAYGRTPNLTPSQWAHKFIGDVVQFKNVVLEMGKAPPPGAQYRSLSESFEDGVLTIEFEAVQ